MSRNLTGWTALLNETNRNPVVVENNARPASRRLAKILKTYQAPQPVMAAPATKVELAIQIGHLDRLLDRTRRGPRQAR